MGLPALLCSASQEASFLGAGDALVACGSDDGKAYIYDCATGMPVKVLTADQVGGCCTAFE